MKCLSIFFASLFFASCAMPLEQLVEQQHQERIDTANAHRPIAQGAADNMGSYIAENGARLSLQTTDARSKTP